MRRVGREADMIGGGYTRQTSLPAHYELTWSQWVFSAASIAVAFVLIAAVGYRMSARSTCERGGCRWPCWLG